MPSLTLEIQPLVALNLIRLENQFQKPKNHLRKYIFKILFSTRTNLITKICIREVHAIFITWIQMSVIHACMHIYVHIQRNTYKEIYFMEGFLSLRGLRNLKSIGQVSRLKPQQVFVLWCETFLLHTQKYKTSSSPLKTFSWVTDPPSFSKVITSKATNFRCVWSDNCILYSPAKLTHNNNYHKLQEFFICTKY